MHVDDKNILFGCHGGWPLSIVIGNRMVGLLGSKHDWYRRYLDIHDGGNCANVLYAERNARTNDLFHCGGCKIQRDMQELLSIARMARTIKKDSLHPMYNLQAIEPDSDQLPVSSCQYRGWILSSALQLQKA